MHGYDREKGYEDYSISKNNLYLCCLWVNTTSESGILGIVWSMVGLFDRTVNLEPSPISNNCNCIQNTSKRGSMRRHCSLSFRPVYAFRSFRVAKLINGFDWTFIYAVMEYVINYSIIILCWLLHKEKIKIGHSDITFQGSPSALFFRESASPNRIKYSMMTSNNQAVERNRMEMQAEKRWVILKLSALTCSKPLLTSIITIIFFGKRF